MNWDKAVAKIEKLMAEGKRVEITFHPKYKKYRLHSEVIEVWVSMHWGYPTKVVEVKRYDSYHREIEYTDQVTQDNSVIDKIEVME